MTSQDYIKAYAMQKVGKGINTHYKRTLEDTDKIIYLSLYKHELVDKECYLVKQIYYKRKLNKRTQTYGVLGQAHFTFGIKNNTFHYLDLEEERGI